MAKKCWHCGANLDVMDLVAGGPSPMPLCLDCLQRLQDDLQGKQKDEVDVE
jgi:hypothetical protein